MKQCVLPVAKPNITHTPVIANMLSILQTNPNTESWIANHFVNIFINNDGIFDNFYDRNMFFMDARGYKLIKYAEKWFSEYVIELLIM